MKDHLLQAIENAKRPGAETLAEFVSRATALDRADVPAAADRAMRIIESIPELLDEVTDAALRRGMGLLVQPLVDHAAEYFIDPRDHAPEAAFGLSGLLDDAYLALSIVKLIQDSYEPLVEADLSGQLEFLRTLLGPDLVADLDAETGRALLKLAMAVSSLRMRSSLDTDPEVPRR